MTQSEVIDVKEPWRDHENYAPHTELLPISFVKQFLEFDRRPGSPQASHPDHWNELKEDISQNGIREPLILGYNPDNQYALLNEGNHRTQISEELGHTHVPVRIYRTHNIDPEFDTKAKRIENPLHTREMGHFPQDMKPSQLIPQELLSHQASNDWIDGSFIKIAIDFEDYMFRKLDDSGKLDRVAPNEENELRGQLNMNPENYEPKINEVNPTVNHYYVHNSMQDGLDKSMDGRYMRYQETHYDNPYGFGPTRTPPSARLDQTNRLGQLLRDSPHIFDHYVDGDGMTWMRHTDRQNDLVGWVGPFLDSDGTKLHQNQLLYDLKKQK
jgi:hypothetical protein